MAAVFTPAAAQNTPVKTTVFPQDGKTVHRIPSIVVSSRGTVLAFADKRVGSRKDFGHRTDVVLRRSTDGGKTWGPVKTLFGHESVCAHSGPALVDRKTNRIFKFFKKHPLRFKNRRQFDEAMTNPETREKWLDWGVGSYVATSDDDGRTWSEPKRLALGHPQTTDALRVGNGNHGLQLDDGTLVIQGAGSLRSGSQRWHDKSALSCLLLSTDGGDSWEVGAQWHVAGAEQEFALAPLAAGRLYVNQRARSFRRVAWLTGPRDNEVVLRADKSLIEPGCHAGVLRLRKDVDGQSVLLFSNPPNRNPHPDRFYPQARHGLTVRMSLDGGRTWTESKELEGGLSAYSDLAEGPDGTIYCIYEAGESFYSENIVVARFGMEWLKAE